MDTENTPEAPHQWRLDQESGFMSWAYSTLRHSSSLSPTDLGGNPYIDSRHSSLSDDGAAGHDVLHWMQKSHTLSLRLQILEDDIEALKMKIEGLEADAGKMDMVDESLNQDEDQVGGELDEGLDNCGDDVRGLDDEEMDAEEEQSPGCSKIHRWTGLPIQISPSTSVSMTSSSTPASPKSGRSAEEDAEFPPFYFFPSMSLIVVLTEPKTYYKFPRGYTLDAISLLLNSGRVQGIEEDEVLGGVRQVLNKRGCVGEADEENGGVVFISGFGGENGGDRDGVEIEIKAGVGGAEIEGESSSGEKGVQEEKGRSWDGNEMFEITSSAALSAYEDDDGHENVGHVVSLLNQQWDSEVMYEHYFELNEGSEPGSGYSDLIDTYSQLPDGERWKSMMPTPRCWGCGSPSHHKACGSRSGSLENTDDAESVCEHLSEDRHPRHRWCETWVGGLDPGRERCAFCDLPFEELEAGLGGPAARADGADFGDAGGRD